MIQTDDIFLGALGLVRGGELVAVDVRGHNGRAVAVFRIGGHGLDELEREYYRGQSLVSVRLLKSEVKRLKDRAFEAIREEERRRHAGEQGGAGADQDRQPSLRGRR